jgi:hypothetical protein
MPKVFAASAIALLISALAIPSARAQRSEEGLLAVWEQAQKKRSQHG